MIGRMNLEYRECPTCKGTGKSKKKRTKPCDTCEGKGKARFCKTCGGMYGTGCVDAPGVLDQTNCTGHSLKTRVGTAYFKWTDDKEAVKEGRRIIGRPDIKEGEKLLLDNKTGQYIIERE